MNRFEPTTALLRAVPDRFADCLVQADDRPAFDVPLARRQHEAYAGRLSAAGLEVVVLAADERYPDCCFVEDTALVLDDRAVLTRPGAPSRRGEVEAIGRALEARLPVSRLADRAEQGEEICLDGGDVLRMGKRLFVGHSGRSNRAGIERLAELTRPAGFTVSAVPLATGLHLKSFVTPLDEERALFTPGMDLENRLDGIELIPAPSADPGAATALFLGGGRPLLVPAEQGATVELLRSMGREVWETETTEFAKGDGGLTCLSILF